MWCVSAEHFSLFFWLSCPPPPAQVLFHLQTRSPAVLPPLCQLFGGGPGAARPMQEGSFPDWNLLTVSLAAAVPASQHHGPGPDFGHFLLHASLEASPQAWTLAWSQLAGPHTQGWQRPPMKASADPRLSACSLAPHILKCMPSEAQPPGPYPAGRLRAPIPDGPAGRALPRGRQQRDTAGAAGLLLRAVRGCGTGQGAPSSISIKSLCWTAGHASLPGLHAVLPALGMPGKGVW